MHACTQSCVGWRAGWKHMVLQTTKTKRHLVFGSCVCGNRQEHCIVWVALRGLQKNGLLACSYAMYHRSVPLPSLLPPPHTHNHSPFPPCLQPGLLRELLLAMSPWLCHHAHHVRTLAQLVTGALLERYPLPAAGQAAGPSYWQLQEGAGPCHNCFM